MSALVLAAALWFAATDVVPGWAEASQDCSRGVAVCVGVVAHVAVEGGKPVATRAWFGDQIAAANDRFAPLGVEFAVREVRPESSDAAVIATRRARDLLGRGKTATGVVHVFLVGRLADVDVAGEEIRGVHWRDRSGSGDRWIILSKIAAAPVFAHELGHFFGLPHSSDQRSIMNKQEAPGAPPWSGRGFVAGELRRMAQARDRMLADGTLVNLAASPR